MCSNTKSFILGALVGMTAVALIPMSDPVMRSRINRCTRRLVRRARAGIEDMM